MFRFTAILTAGLALVLILLEAQPASFRFVIIGDRTGEARPGVYEQVWKDAQSERPAFVVSVGDTIQGLNDRTAEAQWQAAEQIIGAFRTFPLYLVPGNHDIWSARSEQLFEKYAGHPPHYSFDYGPAHFTVLDNSRTEDFSAAELAYLEQDLAAHASQPLKFIVSHRPSWLLPAILGDSNFPVARLAKKYGARCVVAGHLHEMLHASLDGVDYISMASAGGHLRASMKYEDGWFFGYAVVDATPSGASFHIHELAAPYGEGRTTALNDWGKAGLIRQ